MLNKLKDFDERLRGLQQQQTSIRISAGTVLKKAPSSKLCITMMALKRESFCFYPKFRENLYGGHAGRHTSTQAGRQAGALIVSWRSLVISNPFGLQSPLGLFSTALLISLGFWGLLAFSFRGFSGSKGSHEFEVRRAPRSRRANK